MTEEQVINKVKKLLRLSNSPNENEALLAQEKAYELMTKYHLSIDMTDLQIPVKYFDLPVENSRFWTWKKVILNIVSKVNYCSSVYYSRKGSYKITFVGTDLNAQVCKDQYFYFVNAIEKMAKGFRGKKVSYQLGIAMNIKNRISKQTEKIKNSLDKENSLLVIESEYMKENEKFINEKWGKPRKGSGVSTIDYSAYSEGFIDGDQISINKQIRNSPCLP